MILYSRFNCEQYVLTHQTTDRITLRALGRAGRRMAIRRFDEEWLQKRLDLFMTYTYPSVMSQTNKEFKWIGLVHKDSPQWFIDKLQLPGLDIKLVKMDTEAVIRGIPSVNLDTDDAMARDFMAEALKVNFEGETVFRRGMRYRPMTGYWLCTGTDNAHFNIVNHPELTVLDFCHGMYKKIEKQVIDHKRPMWLEVIHEENISNKMVSARADKNMGRKFALKHFELDMS